MTGQNGALPLLEPQDAPGRKPFHSFSASIPWISFIGVGNVIGANNAKNESDIDFFIITRPKNRIWISSLFCCIDHQAAENEAEA
jgi:hypothetical protein